MSLRPLPELVVLSTVLGLSFLLPLPGADGKIMHLPTFCLFYQLTGLPCPLCGMTRAFVDIAHGRFSDSLHWHPLGWMAFAAVSAAWLVCFSRCLAPGRIPGIPVVWSERVMLGGLTLLVVVGFARIAFLLTFHHSF